MLFRVSIILLFIFKFALAQAQDSAKVDIADREGTIKATVLVDQKQVPQNRTLTFTLKISWFGDLERYEIEKLETPVLTNLEILGNSSSNWVGEKGGVKQAIRTYEFMLQPNELGMAYIDGVIVQYKDNLEDKIHSLVTNRLQVEVVEPVSENGLNPLYVIIFAGLLFIALIGAGLISLRRKKIREAESKRAGIDSIPVEDKYLTDLKSRIDLQQSEISEAFASLSKILRRYLSEKHQISVQGITTNELVAELKKSNISEKAIERIEEVLHNCDVAKFSGGQTERGVLERSYTLVEEILNTNKTEFINNSNQVEDNSQTIRGV